MTGRHGLNAVERGAARAERKKSKKMIDPEGVGCWPHRTRRQERFNLGPEIDEVALARPEQGTNADAIPREHYGPTRKVNQHESELTFEIKEQLVAMLLVEVCD
jgi:hypothetical protein